MNVKSAVRVIKVLEYFDSIRREAGVADIARALGYPASSTVGLLKSLMDLGYLVQDNQRMYRPTPRVTLLGGWIDPVLAPGGPVIAMMNELSAETGETIVLGIRSGITARYIHVVPATQQMRLHTSVGQVRPLFQTCMGRALLAGLDDSEVRQLLFRHNTSQPVDGHQITYAAVRRDIQNIRTQGYSVSIDRFYKGVGMVAVLLPEREQADPMAVGVGGLSSSIKAQVATLAKLIANTVERHLT